MYLILMILRLVWGAALDACLELQLIPIRSVGSRQGGFQQTRTVRYCWTPGRGWLLGDSEPRQNQKVFQRLAASVWWKCFGPGAGDPSWRRHGGC